MVSAERQVTSEPEYVQCPECQGWYVPDTPSRIIAARLPSHSVRPLGELRPGGESRSPSDLIHDAMGAADASYHERETGIVDSCSEIIANALLAAGWKLPE